MDLDRFKPPEDDNHVVQFRLRAGKNHAHRPDKSTFHDVRAGSPVRNLVKYQRSPGGDDYRHRMMMNVIVLTFTCTLVMAGIWLALSMVPHYS